MRMVGRVTDNCRLAAKARNFFADKIRLFELHHFLNRFFSDRLPTHHMSAWPVTVEIDDMMELTPEDDAVQSLDHAFLPIYFNPLSRFTFSALFRTTSFEKIMNLGKAPTAHKTLT
jgi:hypothetical protein